MAYTEDELIAFTKPLSDTEDQKAQNSISMVASAIDNYDWKAAELSKPIVKLKGSYCNDTNVKLDSDVDIYVLFTDSYTVNRVLQDLSPLHNGHGKSPAYYREHLQNALNAKFGSINVIRGNKSFKIKENSYKHQTDVVCAFVANDDTRDSTYKGICLAPDKTDDGQFHLIINYPEQDTYKGKQLNVYTDNYYKKIVRILKGIRNDQNLITPSFLIECLVSNVQPAIMSDNTKNYKGKVLAVIDILLGTLRFSHLFMEVNGIKPLFHEKQKWGTVPTIAIDFLNKARMVL
jgi:hypothetical protein